MPPVRALTLLARVAGILIIGLAGLLIAACASESKTPTTPAPTCPTTQPAEGAACTLKDQRCNYQPCTVAKCDGAKWGITFDAC